MKILVIAGIGLLLSACITTRSQMKQEKKMTSKINQLQESRADYEMKMQDVDEQFRQVNGRFEELERSIQQVQEGSSKDSEEEKLNQELQSNKFKYIEEALVKMEGELAQMKVRLAQLEASKAKPKSAKKGNYTQAEIDFASKRWKKAIVGYNKYRELNPKGKRYADATYKIGVCFSELGMKSEAKAFFDEVIEKFPKSRFAQKSQYRLKNMK